MKGTPLRLQISDTCAFAPLLQHPACRVLISPHSNAFLRDGGRGGSMTSWMFWRETGWPPPLLFVMVMMTQATGSPSASSLQNSGLSVTSRAPALWGGRQESLLTRWHTCPERSLMPWSTGSAARGGGGVSDSLSQALKVHIPLEGKVFCGQGSFRDIDAASPQEFSICPAVSNGTVHPSSTA